MKYFFTSTFKSQRTAPFGNTPISFFFSLSLNISCLSFFKKKIGINAHPLCLSAKLKAKRQEELKAWAPRRQPINIAGISYDGSHTVSRILTSENSLTSHDYKVSHATSSFFILKRLIVSLPNSKRKNTFDSKISVMSKSDNRQMVESFVLIQVRLRKIHVGKFQGRVRDIKRMMCRYLATC